METDCPLNPMGHKFFVYKTFVSYEAHMFTFDNDGTGVGNAINNAILQFIDAQPTLYERIEYAILSCNCSATVRRVVLWVTTLS